MKKHLLLAAAAVMTLAPALMAEAPDEARTSTNLTLKWYSTNLSSLAKDTGRARTGVGANGKFYIPVTNKGVEIYDKDGYVKTIDNATTWVSINRDDAGHVYFRNDINGWPGDGGNYKAANARFCVIDSKTDNVIATDVPLGQGPNCRFDVLPQVKGDMVNDDFVSIFSCDAFDGGNGTCFMYDKLNQLGAENFAIEQNLAAYKWPTNADSDPNTIQTVSLAQGYGVGYDDFVAIYANPVGLLTYYSNGWGNGIAKYEYVEDYDNEIVGYTFTGKFFNTPNHSGACGHVVFDYDGKYYIAYPTGQAKDSYPSSDGFFVMPEELVDTPQNSTEPEVISEELHKAVAYHYATEAFNPSNINYRGINVEKTETEGVFNIYLYAPGIVMEMWQLDLTETSTAITDILADGVEANIVAMEGAIETNGANAQVYNPAGALVAEGAGRLAVAAGIYVVKAGNTVAKVVVK